ncbi:MAG: EAL domain-containing protein, partial [Gammaproteobacteria bacterium]|nr:EAL domain-containing protein [Gammaproteobacteria bacterium]
TITEFNASFASHTTQSAFEIRNQDINAKLISVFSTRVIVKGLNNEAEIYCIDIDLSAQKQAEQQANILSQALEQSPMSVVITDPNGIIEYVNETFEQTSGYKSAEVIGQPANVLKSDTTAPSLYKNLWHKISNGQAWQGEFQNKKKDGSLFWEQAYIAPVIDSHNKTSRYLAVKHDITAQKEQEQKIIYQAHFDNLTGLPNRFLSLDRLDYLLRDAKRLSQKVAVLFLDFDDFKKVNDTLGHHEGDQLLIEAARRLTSVIRASDVVGRLGGDEFIVLIPHHNDPNSVAIVAEKLLKQFRQPFQLASRKLVSTISIGIATYPDDGNCSEELLKQADAAMYSSKSQGRNTYTFYTEKMNQDLARRVLIEEKLRLALANNELFVCYQPLINFGSNKIDGAEALLRWYNPILGKVRPDEFIPIAEQTGLIIEIGQFVMAQAIEQISLWRTRYDCNLYISINVSPLQFRQASLIEQTLKLLDQFQLPASAIEFEITEGLLVSGNECVEQALNQLSECGIGLAMDDFGTGYSSLNYLRNYPFDTLKIDKSFIDHIASVPADLKLVSAAISMGHALNLRVIAEGVEDQGQQKLLEQLGCDIGQGYLFGKPVVASEFEQQHFASPRRLN